MIFIFHDNSDSNDDNAFCIVMLMHFPGVTGRPCEETLHWCPPCWLWTFFCPQCLSDWLMGVCGLKHCVCLSFCPPTSMSLPIRRLDYFCLPFNFFPFMLCLLDSIYSLLPFRSDTYPCPLVKVAFWHLFIPQHVFLSACAINLSVWLYSIFPYLPAVFLCFISFICGSHQTLTPDWFPCEQGCSGGPGTSSAGFEAPSHPVHYPQNTPNQHTHPLPHLWLWEVGKYQNTANMTLLCREQTNPFNLDLVVFHWMDVSRLWDLISWQNEMIVQNTDIY